MLKLGADGGFAQSDQERLLPRGSLIVSFRFFFSQFLLLFSPALLFGLSSRFVVDDWLLRAHMNLA